MLNNITIPTHTRTEMINIDNQVSQVVRGSGIQEGICMLWVPHTTAAVTINENADPNVVRDILHETEKIIPFEDGYQHLEGNSAAHIKSSLFGPSLQLIVTNGELLLGTWQSIFYCEFDGPRSRKLYIKIWEA